MQLINWEKVDIRPHWMGTKDLKPWEQDKENALKQVAMKSTTESRKKIKLRHSVRIAERLQEETCTGYEVIEKYKVNEWIKPNKTSKDKRQMRAWIILLPHQVSYSLRDSTACMFRNAIEAFLFYGYEVMMSDKEPKTWDVSWTKFAGHDYGINYKNVPAHAMLYTVPDIIALHHKDLLITSGKADYIRKGFLIPKGTEDPESFSKQYMKNANTLWMVQEPLSKNVMLLTMKEFNILDSRKTWLVSEFVSNPFLIEHRRLELSIYIAITRSYPLAVYMYEPQWLVKLCADQYEPFDRENIDSYIAHDDTQVFKWPSKFKNIVGEDTKKSDKDRLLLYLEKKGHDTEKFIDAINEALYEMVMVKQSEILDSVLHHPQMLKYNFYEVLRVNMVPDNELKPWITDVERRPYLRYGNALPQHKKWVQIMIKDLMKLSGVGELGQTSKVSLFQDVIPDSELHLNSSKCISDECTGKLTCRKQWECRACSNCVTYAEKANLKKAIQEHRNKDNWKRLVPRGYIHSEEARSWSPDDEANFGDYGSQNKLHLLWFREKCMKDKRWCH